MNSTITFNCRMVSDNLGKYNSYTADFRILGSERYKDFCDFDSRNIDDIIRYAKENKQSYNRQLLSSLAVDYLSQLDASSETIKNAKLLVEENTFTIVAGHQPSLFGGPMFLVYKLLSAIKLCQQLNSRQDHIKFVPVYWNGSEDHNRSEFGRVTVFDREHDQIHLALPKCEKQVMACETPVDQAEGLLEELHKILPDTEFLPPLISQIENCLRNNLGETQSRLFLQWFGQYGLVVLEPHLLRSMMALPIKKALTENKTIHDFLGKDTEEMRNMGYAPPLPHHGAERTLVYYIENGERNRLRICKDGFCLERKDVYYGKDELFSHLEQSPDKFSPSAALRPVIQSYIIPVAGYVAGGGELAYHIQLRKLFNFFEVNMPLMIPRAAGTILKSSGLKTMDKMNIKMDDLLSLGWEWEQVESNSLEKGSGINLSFEDFREQIGHSFKQLFSSLGENGVDNFNELERERDRFLSRLESQQKRYIEKSSVIGDGAKRQYFRLRKSVLPGETYQELSVWAVYFIALYGLEIFDGILDSLDPLCSKHHVFTAG